MTGLGVGVGLMRWLNSCYRFANISLGASGLKNAGWTVTAWILPIVNLFKPYQIVNEIYKIGSLMYSGAEDWKKEHGSRLLLSWWIFCAVTHLVGTIFSKSLLPSQMHKDLSINGVIFNLTLIAFICTFSIVFAGLWFVVANTLTQRLIARAALDAQSRKLKYSGTTELSANPERAVADVPAAIRSPNVKSLDQSTAPQSEDAWYEQAYEELVNGDFAKATWARALAETCGDDAKARGVYIRLRVAYLTGATDAPLTKEAEPIKEKFKQVEEVKLAAYGRDRITRTSKRVAKNEKQRQENHEWILAGIILVGLFALFAILGSILSISS